MRLFIYLSLFLVISFSACKETATNPVAVPAKKVEVAPIQRRFMRTTIPHLRVRKTPDLEGTVVQTLQEGTFVEYLHDSTQFTTPIVFNKQTYNNNWYKIAISNKQKGWVYSAFVEFLDAATNKKIIAQKERIALLETASQQQSTQRKEAQQVINEQLLNNYKHYLQQLNKDDPNSIIAAIAHYKSYFVDRTNSRTHDLAYQVFRKHYEQVLTNLQRYPLATYQNLKTEVERYQRAYMQYDAFTQTLARNGFNFGLHNGKVVIVEDVDFLYRVFYREVSVTMRAFMNQYQLEEPNFWWQQEKLKIAPKELARWVLAWNYFVASYPDFMWQAEAKRRLSQQLNILLQGSLERPAFDKSSSILEQDYKEAYLHITQNYPDSYIGRTFQQYVTVLEHSNWSLSSTVNKTQQKVLKVLLK